MKFHPVFLIFLLCWMGNTSIAQQSTVLQLKEDVLRLKEAEDLFEQGLFDEALKKTELVMNSTELTHTEREQVLLITAKINFELDRIEEVDKNIVSLLKTSPNYALNPVMVQQDLLNQFNHYYVIPKLSFSVLGGYNAPVFSGGNNYSLSRDLDYDAAYDKNSTFGGGVDFCYSFRYNFFLTAGFQYNQYGYSRTLSGKDGLEVSYKELLAYQEIPVQLGKRFILFPKQKLFLTVFAQASKMSILKSKADISITYPVYSKDNPNSSNEFGEVSERDINRKNERQNMNTFGAGVELNKKFGNLMISLGGSQSATNKNSNDPTERYSNERLIYFYNYIDNDFQMQLRQLYLKINYTFKYSIKHKKAISTSNVFVPTQK